jgi:hypothetical protein
MCRGMWTGSGQCPLSGELLRTWECTFGYHKISAISCVTERPLVSEERLCSMKLVLSSALL